LLWSSNVAAAAAVALPPAAAIAGSATLGGVTTDAAEKGHQDLHASAAAATAAESSIDTGQQLIEEGLSIDIVAAEAAARPAVLLPTHYAVKGVIDPQSALFSGEWAAASTASHPLPTRSPPQLFAHFQRHGTPSGPQLTCSKHLLSPLLLLLPPAEEPGVLVPLAQGKSHVGDWLAAVEAAGPSTPLSDPMFVGTVFIPQNEVRGCGELWGCAVAFDPAPTVQQQP
jgi:hypothetical protein